MSEYALEITGLKKVYDNNVEALKGIDLKITKGDFLPYLGLMEQVNLRQLE